MILLDIDAWLHILAGDGDGQTRGVVSRRSFSLLLPSVNGGDNLMMVAAGLFVLLGRISC